MLSSSVRCVVYLFLHVHGYSTFLGREEGSASVGLVGMLEGTARSDLNGL